MHIAICTAQVPFVYGGNEVLVDGLRDALTARGHKVEIIALPYKWYPRQQIVSGELAWRLIDITEANGQPVDQSNNNRIQGNGDALPEKQLPQELMTGVHE